MGWESTEVHLQLRIQARRRTLEEYKMRKVRLLQENAKLRTEIEANESETHAEVKKLLRKYEQYRVSHLLSSVFFSPPVTTPNHFSLLLLLWAFVVA